MKLFDTDLGARARSVVQAFAVLVGTVALLLQEVLEVGESLPSWGPVTYVLGLVAALITLLGRFTSIGDLPTDTSDDPEAG